MMSAMTVENLQLVQLLSTNFSGCYVQSSVVKEAAKMGRIEILQWLVKNRSDMRWTDQEVAAKIRGNHFKLAKWMKRNISTASAVMLERWAAAVAGKGNLEMLKWVCSLSTMVNPKTAVFGAVDNRHLEVVKWIMTQPDRNLLELSAPARNGRVDGVAVPNFQIDLYRATSSGHFGVLKWLIANHPEKCRVNEGDIEAAQNGRLDIVRLFYESSAGCFPRRALNSAVAGGHLDIVKWLYNHRQEDIPPGQLLDLAVRNGFLDVVEWLHTNTLEGCSAFAMDGAAENGHFEVVWWLHKHRREGCTSIGMDSAAEKENLELIKWLTRNRKESCSPEAMNLAATNGHLHVVKWLHANRHEGCTVDAMNNAAANSHLKVVQWLDENRSEGCTVVAMDLAAIHGHLTVVEWLHRHRSEGCTLRAMNEAAGSNKLEVVQWLDAYRTEGCSTRAIDTAAERGHIEMVQWLDNQRHEGCTTAAIETAVVGEHFEVALWIYQKHPEYDVAGAVRKCPNVQRRWEFVEWIHSRHPVEFEVGIAERLLID